MWISNMWKDWKMLWSDSIEKTDFSWEFKQISSKINKAKEDLNKLSNSKDINENEINSEKIKEIKWTIRQCNQLLCGLEQSNIDEWNKNILEEFKIQTWKLLMECNEVLSELENLKNYIWDSKGNRLMWWIKSKRESVIWKESTVEHLWKKSLDDAWIGISPRTTFWKKILQRWKSWWIKSNKYINQEKKNDIKDEYEYRYWQKMIIIIVSIIVIILVLCYILRILW